MARLYTNNYSTELDGAIDNIQTTITVDSVAALPAIGGGDTCRLTITDGVTVEIVEATDVLGAVLTVVRGQEGTIPQAWPDTTTVELRATAESYYDLEDTDSDIKTTGDLSVDSGDVDFESAMTFKVPAGPSLAASTAAELGIDTDITSLTGMLKYNDGVEELTVIASPSIGLSLVDGHIIRYSASNQAFILDAEQGGTGTIDGTTGSADNAIVRADGTGGNTIQATNVFIDDDDSIRNPSFLQWDLVGNPSYTEGRMFYDNTEKTIGYFNDESEITHHTNRESIIRVRNQSGAVLTKGSAVRIANAIDAGPEGRAVAVLAQADTFANSNVIGIVEHNIENDTYGNVLMFGILKNVDTSIYAPGDTIVLSETVAGAYTGSPTYTPGRPLVPLGSVIKSGVADGEIAVHVQPISLEYYTLLELDDDPNLSFDLRTNDNDIIFNFGQNIKDEAGNVIVDFDANTFRVNYPQLVPSDTGQPVELKALGSDANIDLNFVSKGTGVVRINGTRIASENNTIPLENKTIDAFNNTITNIGNNEVISDIITGQAAKFGIDNADRVLISDSNDSNNLKQVSIDDGWTKASQAEQEAGTSNNRYVTPANQQWHDSACKAWAIVTYSAGAPVVQASYNVTSVTDLGVGLTQINLTNGFFGPDEYAALATINEDAGGGAAGFRTIYTTTITANNYVVEVEDRGNANQDTNFSTAIFGTFIV